MQELRGDAVAGDARLGAQPPRMKLHMHQALRTAKLLARAAVNEPQYWWDSYRNRGDERFRRWRRALATGATPTPSADIASSFTEAQRFAESGLIKIGDVVLDVGAGYGRQAIGLLALGVREYIGLDVIRWWVKRANRNFSALGCARFVHLDVRNPLYNPNGRYLPQDVTFPLPDRSVDFVCAGSLYTHLERLDAAERYVAETARVLRDGGTAMMSWYRSPPRQIDSSALLTVFAEGDIRRIVESRFVIEDTRGGGTSRLHDQWELALRKR